MAKFTNGDIKTELAYMKEMIRNRIDSILDSNQFFNLAAKAFFDYGKARIFAKPEEPGEWEEKGLVESDDGCCLIIHDTVTSNYKGILKDSLIERGFDVVCDMDWLVLKLK